MKPSPLARLRPPAVVRNETSGGHYNGGFTCWSYDSFGNRLSQSVSTTPCNANPPATLAASYSANNQISSVTAPTSTTIAYDAAGNVTSDGVYTRPWTFAVDEKRGFFGGDGGVPNGAVTQEEQAKVELWEEACQEGLIPGGNDIPGLPSIPVEYQKY